MMEDDLGGRRPTTRFRLSIVGAGLRERGRASGLIGDSSPPAERVRAGALLVFCAWTVFVLAGAAFSKLSEHFDSALPAKFRGVPWGAFKAVQTVAVATSIVVLIGALVAVPAFLRFLHDGGWPSLRRHVLRATAVTAVTMAASFGLVAWANSLSAVQRNGGGWAYGSAFVTWAVLVAATLVSWTVAAVSVGRRLNLTRRVLVVESVLASAVAVGMAAMAGATVLWWAAMAADAPWFLHGASFGTSAAAFEPRYAMAMTLMLAAVVTSSFGVARVARSWGELPAA